ncbi:C40 family peptidase [Mycobacteroides abscessus]|uniref:C40 family peptidase n=2 Tax=Mycobacteroides abscessus TaxID=36809 RepID=UPI0009D5138A|nr:C40 family peptidase [Mycobacteroides abscessus]SLF14722.1 cell wall-associated hydrolase, invasion-associated protein [Mycobacteroides abscessus subsp. massiliense]SLF28877.1 cell wall-associated hydrolase, invasion-associated protein [Mycobacteroides abscessus subsp. massiliense]
MTLDLVVAQVGAHLGRGHSLFAPVATTAGAGLQASADTYESVARRVGDRAQMLDAKGAFAQGFGDAAQRISSRWAATGGFDRLLAGNLADGAAADAAGRGQSGNVINGAVGDTARAQPYTNTAAGQQALVQALRDRLVDQQKVIEAYKQRSAVLAARVRQLGYGAGRQPGGGMGQMLQGLGSSMGRGGGSGGGMGSGMGMPNFGSILKPGNTNSSAGPTGPMGVPNDPDAGLGAPVARAALSKQGAAYVWGAKGPNVFDCSGLTQWAWKQVGVKLGDDTYTQIHQGVAVQGAPRAGDLIFPRGTGYTWSAKGPDHVMMAISATQVVHAPHSGDVVRVAPMPASFVARRPR